MKFKRNLCCVDIYFYHKSNIMEKAIRKQRMTKEQVMQLVSWMIDNDSTTNAMSNGRIAQYYKECTGIDVSSYVIKNNKNK